MSPRYKNKILFTIVKDILPISNSDWERVAARYQQETDENAIRGVDELKRQWREKLCNKGAKPTGKSGDANDQILAAQRVEAQIFNKRNVGLAGDDDDDDDFEDDDEIDDDDEDQDGDEDQVTSAGHDLFGDLAAVAAVNPNNPHTPGQADQQQHKNLKRKNSGQSTGKTKNHKNSGTTRAGAAAGIQLMGNALTQMAQNQQLEFLLQQQAQQAQQNQQFQQMMMMMMMNVMGGNRSAEGFQRPHMAANMTAMPMNFPPTAQHSNQQQNESTTETEI